MANNRLHHEMLYRGKDYQTKLSVPLITVCGAGAIGSNLVDSLARLGFTKIRVVDKDRIETHNLGNQLYGLTDVGALKVTALKTRIFRDVGVEIDAVAKELTEDNITKLLKGSSLVIDVFDNTPSRQLLKDYEGVVLHGGLNTDYGEVVWNTTYIVPKQANAQEDTCEYPLARNVVMLVVTVMAEEIIDWALNKKPRLGDWTVTLKDLAIRRK